MRTRGFHTAHHIAEWETQKIVIIFIGVLSTASG